MNKYIRLLPLNVWLVALLLSIISTSPSLAQPTGAGGPTPVIVMAVTTAEFSDRIEALGTLQAKESVTISSTVTETVSVINFTDGQRVPAGHLLVELNSDELQAILAEAQALLEESQSQYERIKPLIERSAAAKSEGDERSRELKTAQARYLAIKARLRQRLILAPFAGVLGLRNVSLGTLVSPGSVITTIDDDSTMLLDFSVPSTFLATLKPGLPVVALAKGLAGQQFSGEIAAVNSRIDPVTRSIIVRAALPNPAGILRPGLLMTVVVSSNTRSALFVPEEALMSKGKEFSVFVSKASSTAEQEQSLKVEKRVVKIGARYAGQVEILEGLNLGESVVVHGALKLRPDAPVSVLATMRPGDSLTELLKKQPLSPQSDKSGDKK